MTVLSDLQPIKFMYYKMNKKINTKPEIFLQTISIKKNRMLRESKYLRKSLQKSYRINENSHINLGVATCLRLCPMDHMSNVVIRFFFLNQI